MGNFFDKNISFLQKKNPELASSLSEVIPENIVAVETKDGNRVPQVLLDNKKIFVHSKFNPYKEAERFVSEVETSEFDLIIVFGFGYGYHVELLLNKLNENTTLLVLQQDLALIKSALENRDLKNVLNSNNFKILVAPTEDDIAKTLQGKSSHKVSFVTHRGSYQLSQDYYKNLMRITKSYLSTKEVNIATLAKFEKTWSANVSRNINKFINSPGVSIFYNNFQKQTAIVVAAGPSLTKSIAFIKKNIEKAVIIAVDTAYLVLKRYNIEPHFCICVDPQVINARYFEGDEDSNTIMVADPTVHPSVFRLFKGRIVLASMTFDMMKWIEKITGEKGEITHGGSVSTNAYDFANRLGVANIVLVGQDLAFTGGLAHVKGSYLDEQIHNRNNRFMNVQMFNRNQLSALPKIMVKGIKSKKVHTNQKMIIFQSWFEKRLNNKLINATYDGAYINNIKHQLVDDVEIKSSTEKVVTIINNIYNNEIISNEKYISLKEKAEKKILIMQNEIEALSERLHRAVEYSKELCNFIEKKINDKNKINFILSKLSDIDKYIESRTGLKDMVGMTVQRVIHTITEGYELENEENSNNELKTAKRSLFLYEGLKEGTDFNKKILAKMLISLK